MSTIILDQKAIRDLISMPEVIGAVEQAFRDWAQGSGSMPPKAYLLLDQGDFRAMPAALPQAAGVKWVNVHPQNLSQGLPTIMAIMIYNDPQTGYPLAVMDATYITAFRTGATAAIASKYLAKRDSRTLGIIGAGRQAYTQIEAHMQLFDLELIRVFDRSRDATMALINHLPDYNLQECSLEETAASDIICTLTPARAPFLKKEWIARGTHINAVGADAEGKEELEPAILGDAMVVVDDIRQASIAGEINVPVTRKIFSIDEVYGTLGQIIIGEKQGRTDNDTITVFDSTGVAIEDLAVAKLAYEKASKSGSHVSMDIIEVSP
ncbi:MAG TPA: ornithine cyclodeaminase family protein [Dehalococcoidia bacterium]|nr:ornithine cyclodeaminase family protein [Dehalococcoidia bacterium]